MGPNEGRHFFTEMETKTFFGTIQGSLWPPFWRHFGVLGHTFGSKGCPGVVLEGSEKEVEKRGPPESCESHG